jgi:F-type H+-transporting ATPase subunit gamma
MATLRDIQIRIKSVKNTQQITKAMKMVSAAKLRKAEEEIKAARPYAQKMFGVISSLASRTKRNAHPLLFNRGSMKKELIVITSDRGLCGGFNTSILKRAESMIRGNKEGEMTLTLIGRKGKDYFNRRGIPIRKEYKHPGIGDYEFAATVGEEIVTSFIEEIFDEVLVIYNEFKSVIQQKLVVEKLLPIIPVESEEETLAGDYIFEPSQDVILAELLPKHVKVQIFRSLLESIASEHGARMTAMDAASNNAREMISGLTLQFNRLRQASITSELMDIVNGVEAMR